MTVGAPRRSPIEDREPPARPSRRSLGAVLAPDPPRRVPGQRWLGVWLRTAHLATFGILLGGHAFDVDPARLVPFLVATIVSGAGLMALELACTFAWLGTVKGFAVLVKLGVLLAIPLFWEQRLVLLLAVVVLASVVSHMPSKLRHRRLF